MTTGKPTTNTDSLKLFVGGLLLVLGVVICFRAARNQGQDFSYLYVLGRLLSESKNPYVAANAEQAFLTHVGSIPNNGYAAIFYPPTTGLTVMPLSVLPFRAAWSLWLLLSLFLLPLALWRLLKTLFPNLSRGSCLLIVGCVACASSVRWGIQLLQPAPLITAFAVLFLDAVLRQKFTAAIVWTTLALCLKMTLALPFIGILLVCRKFRAAGMAIIAFGLLLAIGFLLAGGTQALTEYRSSMTGIETAAQQVNSPDPYLYQALPRLDFTYLLHFLHRDDAFAGAGGKVLSLLAMGVLLWFGWQARSLKSCSQTAILFFPAFACLTMLIVYHHHYDGLFLLPAFVLIFHPVFAHSRKLLLVSGLPLLLYLTLFPQNQVQMLFTSHGGLVGHAFSKTLGVIGIVLFFCGSLAAISRGLNANKFSLEGEITFDR